MYHFVCNFLGSYRVLRKGDGYCSNLLGLQKKLMFPLPPSQNNCSGLLHGKGNEGKHLTIRIM